MFIPAFAEESFSSGAFEATFIESALLSVFAPAVESFSIGAFEATFIESALFSAFAPAEESFSAGVGETTFTESGGIAFDEVGPAKAEMTPKMLTAMEIEPKKRFR